MSFAVAVSVAAADAPFTYGIAGSDMITYGTGKAGTNYSAAIEVPEAVARELQGGKVTAVSYAFGAGSSKNVEIYLTYELDAEPFYTQSTARVANSVNEVTLDTPYQIEGRAFYIGYNYRQTTSSGKPVVFDGVSRGGMDLFSHLAVWTDKEERLWADHSADGALAIRATVEGARISRNAVLPVAIKLPVSSGTYQTVPYEVTFMNLADAPASEATLATTVGDGEPVVSDISFGTPLASGKTQTHAFTTTASGTSDAFSVAVDVTAVDGNVNLFAGSSVEGSMIVSDFLFPRVVVVEEFNGVDCGYCPAAYVAMEQMREKNLDDYIGISVHNYGADPMKCDAYSSWANTFSGGSPRATVNRNRQQGNNGIFSPQPSTVEAFYLNEKGMVDVCLEMGVEFAPGSTNELDVWVSTYFDYAIDGQQYGYAIVQLEDNVGPYSQRNYYSGGSKGDMFGFEKMSDPVSLIYNDVARAIEGWDGTAATVPQGLKRGERYNFTKRVALGKSYQKTENTRVAVLLIDHSDGHIITANQCRIGEIKSSVPAAIAPQAQAKVRPVVGGIRIDGSYDSGAVYSIDGRRVAVLAGQTTAELPAGIYIVNIDGRSVKVRI